MQRWKWDREITKCTYQPWDRRSGKRRNDMSRKSRCKDASPANVHGGDVLIKKLANCQHRRTLLAARRSRISLLLPGICCLEKPSTICFSLTNSSPALSKIIPGLTLPRLFTQVRHLLCFIFCADSGCMAWVPSRGREALPSVLFPWKATSNEFFPSSYLEAS